MSKIRFSLQLVMILLFAYACREEIPVESRDNDDDVIYPRSEFLFIGNNRSGEIYKIEIGSDSIGDTLKNIESTINGGVTSIDGRKMYVSTFGGIVDVVYGYNLEDLSQYVVSYSTSHLYSTAQGDIIILTFINDNTQTKVGLINPLTDLITYIDTLELRYSVHPAQKCAIDGYGKYLYASTIEGNLIKYHFGEKRIEHVYDTDYSLGNLVLSSDGRRLYNSGGNIIDLPSGDIVADIPIYDNAHLALSPDNKSLYITDPTGKNETGILPTARIFIYSTQFFGVTDQISVHGHVNYLTYTDEISIVEDGTKAYISGFRDVFIVDLVENRTTGVIAFSTEINPAAMFIGYRFN